MRTPSSSQPRAADAPSRPDPESRGGGKKKGSGKNSLGENYRNFRARDLFARNLQELSGERGERGDTRRAR